MAQPPVVSDTAHPKYFTRVIEVTGSGTTRVPFSYLDDRTSGRRGTCETVNADVDVDSRIVIQFDRAWLQAHKRPVVVSVRGELQSGGSSPQIEIAGYSEIGKDRPGFATVRGLGDVAGTLSDYQLAWADLRRRLAGARDSADRLASPEIGRALAARDSARSTAAALRQRAESLTAARVPPMDSAAGVVAAQQATLAEQALEAAESRVGALRQRPAYVESVNPAFVARARRLIMLRQTQLRIPLAVLAGSGGQFVRATLARQRNLDPETVRRLAGQADTLVQRIVGASPPPTADRPADAASWERIQDDVEMLEGLMASLDALIPASAQADAGVVTQELRDAEVLLSQIGAKAGDVVVLHVSDSVPDVVGRRQLDVRFRVRELGFVRRVSDAVLLLRRTGVGGDYQDPRLAERRAAFATTGRADPVEDVPLAANYLPAAGGSLIWTYYHRSGAPWYLKTLAWLTPGVGLNVSFASFPSKTVAFSRPDSAGAPPRETVTLSPDKLQVAAGPVVTVFDNALQFTYGWNLNVPRARQYFGVGFSFVNIAKRLGVSLGGTEAEK